MKPFLLAHNLFFNLYINFMFYFLISLAISLQIWESSKMEEFSLFINFVYFNFSLRTQMNKFIDNLWKFDSQYETFLFFYK